MDKTLGLLQGRVNNLRAKIIPKRIKLCPVHHVAMLTQVPVREKIHVSS